MDREVTPVCGVPTLMNVTLYAWTSDRISRFNHPLCHHRYTLICLQLSPVAWVRAAHDGKHQFYGTSVSGEAWQR